MSCFRYRSTRVFSDWLFLGKENFRGNFFDEKSFQCYFDVDVSSYLFFFFVNYWRYGINESLIIEELYRILELYIWKILRILLNILRTYETLNSGRCLWTAKQRVFVGCS